MKQIPDGSLCVGWFACCCVIQGRDPCSAFFLVVFFRQSVVHVFGIIFVSRPLASAAHLVYPPIQRSSSVLLPYISRSVQPCLVLRKRFCLLAFLCVFHPILLFTCGKASDVWLRL